MGCVTFRSPCITCDPNSLFVEWLPAIISCGVKVVGMMPTTHRHLSTRFTHPVAENSFTFTFYVPETATFELRAGSPEKQSADCGQKLKSDFSK
jgi:hypothetical protein